MEDVLKKLPDECFSEIAQQVGQIRNLYTVIETQPFGLVQSQRIMHHKSTLYSKIEQRAASDAPGEFLENSIHNQKTAVYSYFQNSDTNITHRTSTVSSI